MCGRLMGSAVMDERGWLEFDEAAFLLPGDEPKNTVRYECPRHGIHEVATDVIRFNARRELPKKEEPLVIVIYRDAS